MKINLAKHNDGLIWLVLFVFIPAALLAAYLLYKILTWHPTYDHTHGNPELTNDLNNAIASLHQQYGSNATVLIREFGLTLPIDSLAYEWVYVVQESTNLVDWTPTELEWDVVLESIQTNHALPQMFFRRVMILY